MKVVTFHLPDKQLEDLEKLVTAGYYPSRSEAIRFAIMELIRDHNTRRVIVEKLEALE